MRAVAVPHHGCHWKIPREALAELFARVQEVDDQVRNGESRAGRQITSHHHGCLNPTAKREGPQSRIRRFGCESPRARSLRQMTASLMTSGTLSVAWSCRMARQ